MAIRIAATLLLLAACEPEPGGLPSSGVSPACQLSCDRDTVTDEDRAVCAEELTLCYAACEQLIAGAEGQCLGCLSGDGVLGPYAHWGDDKYENQIVCEPAAITGDDCSEACY